MKKFIVPIVIAIALVGAGIYAFKGSGPTTSLGKGVPADAQVVRIGDVISGKTDVKHKEITVTGEMTERCPTAGCWFYVKDSTGSIRVDTAPSGFTMLDVPLHKQVTVHGRVVKPESGELEIVALGVKY